jgi:hypothetical protein
MHIGTSDTWDTWDRLYTQAFGHIVYQARSGVFVYNGCDEYNTTGRDSVLSLTARTRGPRGATEEHIDKTLSIYYKL